jgi:hypothetical protein
MHRQASDRIGFWRAPLLGVVAACLVGLMSSSPVVAQDDGAELKPEILDEASVEKRISWVLDFKPIKVRMVTPRRGPKKGETYWYLVYQIENRSTEDHDFYLAISANSDRKKTYSDLFLPSVERAVEYQEKVVLWGKTDKFHKVLKARKHTDRKYSYETIKGGEKRLCVAVFNRFDPNSKNLTIRVKGLTNDIEVVAGEGGDEGTVLRQRVRIVHIRRPGDEYEFGGDSFKRMRMEWIHETTKAVLPEGGS